MHSSASTTEETSLVVRRLKNMNIAPRNNNSLFCGVCQVYVSSDVVMQTHVHGKRHIELGKLQKKQMSSAAKSIYVRGHPSGSTSNEIAQFFTGFGKVDKVVLEKEHGYYAIVEFNDESTVESMLSMPLVMMNGSRLTIKSRLLKGLPPKRKTRQSVQSNAKDNTSSTLDATGNNDLLERMKHCSDMMEEMNLLTNELLLSSDDILHRHFICQEIENILRTNLFPVCSIHPFGSSVNGLGSKGCDLDIFLNLESDRTLDGLPFTAKDLLCDVPDLEKVPCTSPAATKPNGSVSDPEVVNGSMDSVLQLVQKISDLLHSNSHLFSRVIRVSNARCPVVKFVHVQSGLKCDLSINNRLALCNTMLLRFLLNSDDRIRPLIVSVRHWAKLLQVTGQRNTGSKLTSYALTMVVVFYLQNISPPVVPSIQELSHLADKPCVIDGWDCAFTTDLSKIPKTENRSTVEELLTGFFEFFVQFDFSHKIMSIRSGESIHLTSFSEQMASDSRLKGFKICPVLIQDPFVLNHNIASNVNEKSRTAIHRSFLAATHLIKDKSASGQRPRLSELLSLGIESSRDSLRLEFQAHNEGAVSTGAKASQTFTIKSDVTKMMEEVCRTEKTLGEIENIWCQNAVKIILETLKVFHTSYESLEKGGSSTRSNTTQQAEHSSDHDPFDGNVVEDASLKNNKRCLTESDGCTSLKRAKGSSHEITTTDEYKDANKTADASDLDQASSCIFSARCSTNSRSWLGRKKLRTQLPHITDERERELEISRLIELEQDRREVERAERASGALLAFDMSVWIDKVPETAVVVSLEPIESNEHSGILRGYFFPFRSVVEKLVDKYAFQDIEKWNSPATLVSDPTTILKDN